MSKIIIPTILADTIFIADTLSANGTMWAVIHLITFRKGIYFENPLKINFVLFLILTFLYRCQRRFLITKWC